jgi:murein DD-endopeptidase MepM/ murein hydrolase activator NlpD
MKKIFVFSILILWAGLAYSQQGVDVIQDEISEASEKIKELEEKIKEDEEKLAELAGEKQSLNSALINLNYSSNKVRKEIIETEGEIGKVEEEIKTLSEQIEDKASDIEINKESIAKSIKEIDRSENQSMLEVFLLNQTIGDFFDKIFDIRQTTNTLNIKTEELLILKEDLEKQNKEREESKENLGELATQLADQKKVIDINAAAKQRLLNETKNEESAYQVLLAEKLKEKEAFEKQLFELESRLRVFLEDGSFPDRTPGLFSWPSGVRWVTQYFGKTTFTDVIYNGSGHNGVDFGTPVGTPIKSVMDGVITDTGDTETACPGIQYGRWVLVDHQNGLSSLYAHLSVISADAGDVVKRGSIIGYSGNTGYSTGPHLHLSTFATQGVQVKTVPHPFAGSRCYGVPVKIPIAAHNAYLDPFAYLPMPSFNFKPVKQGDSGSSVKALQDFMKYDGVFPRTVSANGNYGPTTAASVERLKDKYGLSGGGSEFTSDNIDDLEDQI